MLGATRLSRSGAWTPLSLSGIAAWYDASDTSSITETGGLASQWNDLTSNGYHLTATGTQRPTTGAATQNSLNVLQFDGSANQMIATRPWGLTASHTIMVAGKVGAAGTFSHRGPACSSSNKFFVGGHQSTQWGSICYATLGAFDVSGTDKTISFAPSTNDLVVMVAVINRSANTLDAAKNGTYGTQQTGLPGGNERSGGDTCNTFYAFDVYEVIVTTSAMSTSDESTARGYLNTKWALP